MQQTEITFSRPPILQTLSGESYQEARIHLDAFLRVAAKRLGF